MLNRQIRFATLISAMILLAGCTTAKVSLEDISKVDKTTEVIIVGRIEMMPKITKEELSLKMVFGGDELYKNFMIRTGTDIGEMTDYTTDADNMAVVKTEEDFYISHNRDEPFKLFGGWFYTQLHGGSNRTRSTVFFHIKDGMQIEIPKNANVVYLGNIKFKRDEFFNLKDIDLSQDGFDAAQKRFQKKFNTKMTMVKAKVTPVKK